MIAFVLVRPKDFIKKSQLCHIFIDTSFWHLECQDENVAIFKLLPASEIAITSLKLKKLMTTVLGQKQLRWYGRVLGKEGRGGYHREDATPAGVQGKRRRGRPKKS